MKKRIGIYAGTFDPFTIGHQHIVERAEKLFDEVHILIGVNFRKSPFQPTEKRLESIRDLYKGDEKIKVVQHDGIVAKYAISISKEAVLIRGIRTVADMEAERTIADVNRNHYGIDTIFLFSDAKFSSVSSSLVRELATFGEDYSEYLPKKGRAKKES
ncbi:pantetheine-phosphate adenylyltransferase [Porphyromonadaceae bacterium W3.11]|nr:pantetheine-phosphate adenylyltransferase [Porphyromonadaceae bacterium W3.11]